MKAKEPTIPPESSDTVRHRIVDLIAGGPMSAKDISQAVGIPEKEVYDHLTHLQHRRRGERIVTIPAMCRSCGFVFRKRERTKKPGRCPVCRSEYIAEPLFAVAEESL